MVLCWPRLFLKAFGDMEQFRSERAQSTSLHRGLIRCGLGKVLVGSFASCLSPLLMLGGAGS